MQQYLHTKAKFFYAVFALLITSTTIACSPYKPIVNESETQTSKPDVQLTEIERIRKVEIEGVLSNVDAIIAYSLYHLPLGNDKTFLGKKVMGEDVVAGGEARSIKAQYHLHEPFRKPVSIRSNNGFMIDIVVCGSPPPTSFYQGIRIKEDNDTYDFLICINCKKINVFKNEAKIWEGNANANPDVQNAYFRSRNIPVDDYYLKRN